MSGLNKLGWLLSLIFGVVTVYSVYRMSFKVDEFNKHSGFTHFRFQVMGNREFSAFGKPVTLTDESDGKLSFLRIKFGAVDRRVPVKTPPMMNIPSMGIYDEWAKVLEIHEVGRDEAGDAIDKQRTGRVVLVVRRTPDGYDPETWGTVFRDSWTFDFYEFKDENGGTLVDSSFRWPRGELGDMTLERLVKEGNKQAIALAALPELAERSWQYQAALHVIPKLNVPKYRFQDDAVSAMGWTLPTAGFCGLITIIGLCMGFAPRRVRIEDENTISPKAA
jgi:hypothetical protein